MWQIETQKNGRKLIVFVGGETESTQKSLRGFPIKVFKKYKYI